MSYHDFAAIGFSTKIAAKTHDRGTPKRCATQKTRRFSGLGISRSNPDSAKHDNAPAPILRSGRGVFRFVDVRKTFCVSCSPMPLAERHLWPAKQEASCGRATMTPGSAPFRSGSQRHREWCACLQYLQASGLRQCRRCRCQSL